MMDTFNLFKEITNLKKNNQNEIIENNESFCMAPWVHLNISPSGDVPVCCNIINSKETVLGNVNDNTLEEIWNSTNMKNIRMKMLKGEKIKECSNCYYREEINKKASMRYEFNNKYFNNHKNILKETKNDGFLEKTNIVFIDFRFSNKCNFSCRTCAPQYSSGWEKKLKLNLPKINNVSKTLKEMKDMISQNKLEEIYFAGGETLIMDEHWEIIDFLIENKKFDIEIRYNTNLSVLNYKGNNFLEKMKNFNNLKISPSCDSLGVRGEYIRTGFSNDVFLRNIKLLKDYGYKYNITTVMSFFNVTYLYDFFKDLKDNEIEYDNLYFITLTKGYDYMYSIYNLPPKVLDMTLEGIDKLIDGDFISQNKKKYFKNLKDSIKDNNLFDEQRFKKSIDYIKFQDSINKLQFKDCFPDLYHLISKYF